MSCPYAFLFVHFLLTMTAGTHRSEKGRMRMADERNRRAPALATQIDDPNRRPDKEDWSVPSTAETRCQSCDGPLPRDAAFCPACRHKVGAPVAVVGEEAEKSIVVDDASLGAEQMPASAPTVAPAQIHVVEVRVTATAQTPAAVPVPTPAPAPAGARAKGLDTLTGEAVKAQALVDEDVQALRRIATVLIPAAAVIAALFLVWLLAFRDRPHVTQPVTSSAPISLLPYDAGTD